MDSFTVGPSGPFFLEKQTGGNVVNEDSIRGDRAAERNKSRGREAERVTVTVNAREREREIL